MKVPIGNQSRQESQQSRQESQPSHKESQPSHKESQPSHKESQPSHKESQPSHKESQPSHQKPQKMCSLLAIGASSGGPKALLSLLSELPASFPLAVVVVQHIDKQHAEGMAQWLDKQVPLKVEVIAGGERPEPGKVLLTQTNDHLRLNSQEELIYTTLPLENSYRPSVDEFFCSAALHWRGDITAVLLTGMGWDGGRGLLALRRLGHHTFAQDQSSCTIYGMPREAAERQAAMEVLPPHKIGLRLSELVKNLSESSVVSPGGSSLC